MKKHLPFQSIKSTLTPRCSLTPLSIRSGHLTGGYLARFVALARPNFAPSGRKLRIPASRYVKFGFNKLAFYKFIGY